jgi:hypothetical protein
VVATPCLAHRGRLCAGDCRERSRCHPGGRLRGSGTHLVIAGGAALGVVDAGRVRPAARECEAAPNEPRAETILAAFAGVDIAPHGGGADDPAVIHVAAGCDHGPAHV